MVHFVILCGGSGTRLWPKSREKLPKQLLSLTNEFTMFQNTVKRLEYLNSKTESINNINNINNINKLFVICNKEHAHLIELQLEQLSVKMEYFIVSEPIGRDSAPAICMSSLFGTEEDYTFVLPSDHVLDEEEFSKCCIQSFQFLDDSIVTFGITPTHIETGYGYIETNKEYKTLQFVEKPDYETAKKYLSKGTYLWNAGIFAFKNKNMLQCFQRYAPDILTICIETNKNTPNSKNMLLSSVSFSNCRAISVDYAIMEKLCSDLNPFIRTITLPYQSYWNDIGSYLALYNEMKKDENNNVLKGDIFTLHTKNSYIESNEKSMVATIGVNNLIVVNTEDALLICNNENTQDVKKVVEYLKKENREESILHKKVYRPWGYYINVEGKDNNGFKIKRIAVYSGKRLSLQSHNHRSEHWVIVKGKAKVQVGKEYKYLEKDQHVYIPTGELHRIENIGEELLEFTETQIGNYLGEDDIIRYEDDFGRA